jgi:hypothetical protein
MASSEYNPFQAPQASESPRPIRQERDIRSSHARLVDYRPLNWRAGMAGSFLVLSVVVCILTIGVIFLEIGLLEKAKNGQGIDEQTEMANNLRLLAVGGAAILTRILTIIFFCMWAYRAYGNLTALGAYGLRTTPGWIVGYFFIPIMQLFRPYQLHAETWKASDPDVPEWHPGVPEAESAPIVGLWWTFWLLSLFAERAAMKFPTKENDFDSSILSDWVTIAAELLTIAAGVFAILVVRGITQRQEEKFERLSHAKSDSTGYDPWLV